MDAHGPRRGMPSACAELTDTRSLLQLASNIWSTCSVGAGDGKGWARGRTASSDARIARNADAHRGMTYERHVSPNEDRRHRHLAARTLPLEWSPVMAYVVGSMATDGCLVNTGRHLSFGSSDRELVETFLECLGRPVRVETLLTRKEALYYRTQFGDVRFHEWLRGIGLMPRKSLVLGPLAVPDGLLIHCARGLLDGDGSIINYRYDGGGKAAGRRYEGLTTRFISASRAHISWLRDALRRVAGVEGNVSEPPPGGGCWAANYAIRESTILLPMLYPSTDVPKLERKWLIWKAYAERHGHSPTLPSLAESTANMRQRPKRDSLGRFQTLALREDRPMEGFPLAPHRVSAGASKPKAISAEAGCYVIW